MQYPVTFVGNTEEAMETVLEDGCILMADVSTRLGWIKLSLLPLSKRALTFHSVFISTVADDFVRDSGIPVKAVLEARGKL